MALGHNGGIFLTHERRLKRAVHAGDHDKNNKGRCLPYSEKQAILLRRCATVGRR
ncbi:hypothetical protein SAMN05192589_1176 [Paracidovorax valerianellae]|uniref:Uncharacterized protein n=1 Tax=Paracidovorax valerianellae TaxID=187868 RepID=A0A1G7CQH9_9BURK|nr:hypothetical protein SAMN05192589_1176 [Paracidovorax valerianellae]